MLLRKLIVSPSPAARQRWDTSARTSRLPLDITEVIAARATATRRSGARPRGRAAGAKGPVRPGQRLHWPDVPENPADPHDRRRLHGAGPTGPQARCRSSPAKKELSPASSRRSSPDRPPWPGPRGGTARPRCWTAPRPPCRTRARRTARSRGQGHPGRRPQVRGRNPAASCATAPSSWRPHRSARSWKRSSPRTNSSRSPPCSNRPRSPNSSSWAATCRRRWPRRS